MRHHNQDYYCIRVTRQLVVGLCCVLFSGVAMAADIGQYPLFLQQQIQPNVMFTLDNSGSMAWETMTGYDTDTTSYADGQTSKRASFSSSFNKIYYDPAVTYARPPNYDGSLMAASDPASASSDGYPTTGTTKYTVNLKSTCYAKATPVLPQYDNGDFTANTTNCKAASSGLYTTLVPRYAYYYVWDGSTNIKMQTPPDGAFPTRVNIINDASYPKIKTGTRDDCTTVAGKCTYDEEMKNFANWFTYYRTRIMMAKASMGSAFVDIDPVATTTTPRFRVGFNAINSGGSSNTSVSDSNASWLAIRKLNSTQKNTFFNKIYASKPDGSTPLRTQMNRIGKMYMGTLDATYDTNNNPYYRDITESDKTLVPCRASYHIMTTDGYWNDSYTGVGDVDHGCSTGGTCYSTRARGSYDSVGTSNTLADIALYYYKTDLRSSLANKVPKGDGDPPDITDDEKMRQRMVTFTVGLGADGQLGYTSNYETATTGDFYGIKQGTKNWPAPVSDGATTIDDLWHAAVNGRGKYFKATNSTELREGLIETLKKIDSMTATAGTEAISSVRLSAGTYVYEPSFDSGLWTGHLKAFAVDGDGNVSATEAWDAANLLPAYGSRNIVTMVGTTPQDFLWANLSSTQKTALASTSTEQQNLVNYLRGDSSKEKASGGTYRDRSYVKDSVVIPDKLGDIVNSAPLYAQKTNFGYTAMDDLGAAYYTYINTTKPLRTPAVFVGANDGMVHGFNASTGVETFAYVPAAVYSKLKNLSRQDYDHKFYVDGPLTENDVYNGGWKTYMFGSTGAGAKSVFAIDISSPTALTKDSVLWEMSDSDSTDGADMGYVLGEGRIVRLRNGSWAAVHGNGYYSSNYAAVLFVRNIASGATIGKVSVNTGTSSLPNGLSAPAFLYNSKRQVAAAYAGDVRGNLWKFKWCGGDAPTATKLFSATNGGGQVQPITQRPALRKHSKGGYIVTFGTGKYFDSTDGGSTDTNVQSMYGIWDTKDATLDDACLSGASESATVSRSSLQQQTLTAVSGGASLSGTAINWDTQRGWYVDMTLNSGERAIADPIVLDDVVYIKSLIPSGTICSMGGDSMLYGLNVLTGGKNVPPTFGTLDVIKLEGGGTAGLKVVQTADGKFHVWTKTFDRKRVSSTVTTKFPGYRTWRQIPVNY